VNMFVATFIGSPQMNLVEGTATTEGSHVTVKGTNFQFTLPAPSSPVNGKVIVGFRPEHLTPGEGASTFRAEVEVIEPMGSEAFIYLKSEKGNVVARVDEAHIPKVGDTYTLTIDPAKVHLFDPGTEKRLN
ncbi:MAG TPA: TOBE domain-containing protein, partial [Oscillatoriaceae cyanobacterium]